MSAAAPAKSPVLSYDKLIDQGTEFQFLADSLHDLTAKQRKELEMLTEPQKSDLQKKIGENEKLEAEYQKSADQKFADAKAVSTSGKEISKEAAVTSQTIVPAMAVSAPLTEKPKEAVVVSNTAATGVPVSPVVQEKPKEAAAAQQAGTKIAAVSAADNVKPEPAKAAETQKAEKSSVELYSLFEITPGPEQGQPAKQSSDKEFRLNYHYDGKNWWDPDAKITIDPPVGAGLIYRIQMAVFRNPVKPSYFKGIAPVYGFKITGTDKTIYYAGLFRKLSDANKALAAVKSKGFIDAFVVPLSDNKRIPSDKAAAMEKEWGKKPFISAAEAPGNQQYALDTIPPALSFRVEAVRSQKPLKVDAVEGIRKVAGSRGVDIQTYDNGSCAYLIGKFITFESASEYSDLLIKNGYREAHVVAFLGIKEIPIETAKQLFENLK